MKKQKIWQKNSQKSVNKAVENYTVGVDYLLDLELLQYDIKGSVAHAKMLKKIGILKENELKTLLIGLNLILSLWKKGKFMIDKSQEDGHTAIETFLIEKYGEVGKKIHTGRSRNDQSMVMVRLFMKEKLLESEKLLQNLIFSLNASIKKQGKIKMPGYTHMQRAMPSSVGMWLGAFHDSLEDGLSLLYSVIKIIDQNPLGSAAGYGENVLGLDRNFTTKELGFTRLQKNPMYCGMSRGKFENISLEALNNIMFDLGKLASDLMLFTTKEFDFFDLPDSFKTGSSLMPQKNNYDVLELVRGNVGIFQGYQQQIQNVIKNLPSGYNRDFQLTKEPYIKATKLAIETLKIMTLVVKNLKVKKDNLEQACSKELYSTDEALKLVKSGVSFREAYLKVKENLT